jgi:hypothetical protein
VAGGALAHARSLVPGLSFFHEKKQIIGGDSECLAPVDDYLQVNSVCPLDQHPLDWDSPVDVIPMVVALIAHAPRKDVLTVTDNAFPLTHLPLLEHLMPPENANCGWSSLICSGRMFVFS